MSSKRNPDDERLKAAFIARYGVKKIAPVAPAPLPETDKRVFVEEEPQQKIYAPVSLDAGEMPQLLWLETSDLHIDPSYQRAISTRRGQTIIKEIVEHFRWSRFQPVTVTNRPDGGYWLIDGQHRALAASQRNIDKVPAVLLPNLGTEEQARVFAGINGKRVAVSAMTIHYAMVASGDIDARRIQKCCESADVKITRYPKMAEKMHPCECMAVAALGRAIKKYGEEAVVSVLRSIRATYPNTPGMLTKGNIEERLQRHVIRQIISSDEA